MKGNFYNENDPKAAAWLRELIRGGHIPAGVVDERSIADIQPAELSGFVQCHFFAGIGGWPLALRLAGWPDTRPAWTGSAPCPPFSAAGKKKACPECGGKPIPHPLKTGIFACVPCGHEWFADGRHLYPEFYRLIRDCGPATVFGEQVAGADGLIWLAGVRATLEALGYGVGSSDLCAAWKAPHLRQRLYWLAHHKGQGRARMEPECEGIQRERARTGGGGTTGTLADSEHDGGRTDEQWRQAEGREVDGRTCGLGDTESRGCRELWDETFAGSGRHAERSSGPGADGLGDAEGSGRQGRALCNDGEPSDRAPQASVWSDFDIIMCRDGKARRIESGTFPLAHGIPHRVGLLRGYGNAIVPQLAAEFIKAFLETK